MFSSGEIYNQSYFFCWIWRRNDLDVQAINQSIQQKMLYKNICQILYIGAATKIFRCKLPRKKLSKLPGKDIEPYFENFLNN